MKLQLCIAITIALFFLGCNTKESNKSFIFVSQQQCDSNYASWGVVDGRQMCIANFNGATAICQSLGLELPQIDELRQVVLDCGGILDAHDHNTINSQYQECYQKMGFVGMSNYWSATVATQDSNYAYDLNFFGGKSSPYYKINKQQFVCIKR